MQIFPERSATAALADGKYFTGSVWRTDHIPRVGADGMMGNRFVYSPGSRSHWHVHDGHQAIVVVQGRGVVDWKGEELAHALYPGDWLHVEPGVEHWHGAGVDDVFAHLAVTAQGGTQWLGPVSDADYARAQRAFG